MIDIIGMPIHYGCDVLGAEKAYDVLKKDFNCLFIKNKINKNTCINVNSNSQKHLVDKKLKYVEEVIDSSKKLYNEVKKSLNSQKLPIIIGGDHTTAIGSISASLDVLEDVTVIWVDAHADIHTEITSPSGNLHGLPVAICMQRCDEKFNIGKNKLKNENLIYIDLRSFEEEELKYIQENNIKYYLDSDIKKIGIQSIIKEVIKNVKTKYVHLSFDVDAFDQNEFGAVNVAYEKRFLENGGISFKEGLYIIEEILKNTNVKTIDIVEYNYLLDKNSDLEKMKKILKTIDNNIGGIK